ncbi:MAG: hypothetical protein KGL39_15770 [Patescibacteria group bacterium]|nr:hypothetical protein [Patescibacteria group bacterium]
MKEKIILTRNFKNQTAAKYCAARFGDAPDTAIEIERITLEDVTVVSTHTHPETRNFEDFGCGVIIIGHGEMPEAAKPQLPQRIFWTGGGFRFTESRADFVHGRELVATPDGMSASV